MVEYRTAVADHTDARSLVLNPSAPQPVPDRASPSPAFSVIMPAYNTGPYIEEAIRSVLAQTRQDWQLVIVDDGSPDDLAERVETFTDDPRVIFIRQENGGVAAARNTALAAADGEWLITLDSDDLIEPEYMARMAQLISENPNVSLITPDARLVDEAGNDLGRNYSQMSAIPPAVRDDETVTRLLGHNIFIPMSAARRSVVTELGGWDTNLNSIEDYDLWLRLAAAGHGCMIALEPLAVYRVRAGSITRDADGHNGRVYQMRVLLMEKVLRRDDLSPRHRRIAERSLRRAEAGRALADSRSALHEGDYSTSRSKAWEAWRTAHLARHGLIATGVGLAPAVMRRIHARGLRSTG